MAVDIATFLEQAPIVLGARFPVMIRSYHGVGKSELVYQIADLMSLECVERRASVMTEGDTGGLPLISKDSNPPCTTWAPPDWLLRACQVPVVLFLDEVDRASAEVRQSLMELTDSRKLNGHRLHEGTVIIAATNGGSDSYASNYSVNTLDPAELDRWTIYDLRPSVSEWISWACSNGVNPLITDFIRENPKHLEHLADIEPSKVYPSRRSWTRFNKAVNSTDWLSNASPRLFTLCEAFCGSEAAIALNEFVKNYDRVITVEDLLDGKIDKKLFAKMDNNSHLNLIDKFEQSGKMEADLTDVELQNAANYLIRLPSEIAMKMYTGIGCKSEKNLLKLSKTLAVDGKKKIVVSMHIVDICNATAEADKK